MIEEQQGKTQNSRKEIRIWGCGEKSKLATCFFLFAAAEGDEVFRKSAHALFEKTP